jgi:DNA polymerase
MTTERHRVYDQLVVARKACNRCKGLRNPADIEGGKLDCGEVGTWSSWQGKLDAEVLVVGQDWGVASSFVKSRGLDTPSNQTNRTLVELLGRAGVSVTPPTRLGRDGEVFFTNAILCFKDGNDQAAVRDEWFQNCGSAFLRPTIEFVQPRVVVALGAKATHALATAFGLKVPPFARAVALAEGLPLTRAIRMFPRYHCGARGLKPEPVERGTPRRLGEDRRVAEIRPCSTPSLA